MRKISADNLRWAAPRQRKGEVAGAAAKIEHASIAPLQDWPETPRCTSAPHAILLQRQQMIQEVVARRDFRKHFAHFA
jgi:hypothetical protein